MKFLEIFEKKVAILEKLKLVKSLISPKNGKKTLVAKITRDVCLGYKLYCERIVTKFG